MFAKTVGLDDSFDFFSLEESRPWRGRNVNTSSASGTCELVPLVLKLSL